MGGSEELSDGHWFEPLAAHMGLAYLRYSFTKGTRQEVDALEEMLELEQGCSVLDVGCGPGRHALEFARRGYRVTGLDISETFIEVANAAAESEGLTASFVRQDALALPGRWSEGFDAVVCLCQGGFGLMLEPEQDERVFQGVVGCLREGGKLALSAFNAYFAIRHFADASFDAAKGMNEEQTEVRDGEGRAVPATLWTGCYTPKELSLLARLAGLGNVRIFGVEPGSYGRSAPSVDLAEFLLVAERSSADH